MNEIVTVAVSLCIVFPLREGRISSLPTRPSRSVKSGVPLFKLGRPHIDKSGVPRLQSDSSYQVDRPHLSNWFVPWSDPFSSLELTRPMNWTVLVHIMISVYLIIVAIVAPSHDAMRLDWTVSDVLSFHIPCLSDSDNRSISLECSLSALCQYEAMVFSLSYLSMRM